MLTLPDFIQFSDIVNLLLPDIRLLLFGVVKTSCESTAAIYDKSIVFTKYTHVAYVVGTTGLWRMFQYITRRAET